MNPLLSDIPAGYYDNTDGLYGEMLKDSLHDIIRNHTAYSYNALRDYVLPDTDEDPNNPNNVLLIYTGFSRPKTAFGNGADNWNREHVWAISHGDLGTGNGPGTDAHHIRPSHPLVNSSRGNKDFDFGGEPHPIAIGNFSDNDSWEPRDAVKGDIARMIMYMEVRYNSGSEIDLEMTDIIPSSPNGEPLHGKKSSLLTWHEFDPPDSLEMFRHERIFNWQNNRNPFIDHPEFASYIWGETVADFSSDITMGFAPLLVNFSDISSHQGNIVSWSWDFDGDGLDDSELQNPTFVYNEDGIFDVSLTIEDHFGNTSTKTRSAYIRVGEDNIPVAIFEDSFETTGDWQIYSVASSNDWFRTDVTGSYSYPTSVPEGEWYMYVNNYQSNQPADDWLISPAVDLRFFADITLSFCAWTKFTESILGMEVLVSADYSGNDDPYLANWTALNAELPATNSNFWTDVTDFNLSDWQGEENLHLAFHYTSTGTSSSTCVAWAVDNIRLYGLDISSSSPILSAPVIELSNYPNPFSTSGGARSMGTTISFFVNNVNSQVDKPLAIEIYNLKGQKIKSLDCGDIRLNYSGFVEYSVYWNGTNRADQPLSSGIYIYRLNLHNSPAGKMLLLK